mmetsp:Transcript_58352/g.182974  ORF Transcript_58352/g.182974 Transcript_58352/m.182974 type:complete len:217 (+) Transcript_58352:2332-2982(+)
MRGVTPSLSATFTSAPYASTSCCATSSCRRLTAAVSSVTPPGPAASSPAGLPTHAETSSGPVALPRRRRAANRCSLVPALGSSAQCSGARPAASRAVAADGSSGRSHPTSASFSDAAARWSGNSPDELASAGGAPRSRRPSASFRPPSAPRRPGCARQSTCRRLSPVSGTRPRRMASSRTLRSRVRANSAFPMSRASCRALKRGNPSSSRRCATPK